MRRIPRAVLPLRRPLQPYTQSRWASKYEETLKETLWKDGAPEPGLQTSTEAPKIMDPKAALEALKAGGYTPATDARKLKVIGIVDPLKDNEWVVETFIPKARGLDQLSNRKVIGAIKRAFIETHATSLYPDVKPIRPEPSVAPISLADQAAEENAVLAKDEENEMEVIAVKEVEEREVRAAIKGEGPKFYVGDQPDFTQEVRIALESDGGVKLDFGGKEIIEKIILGRDEVPREIVHMQRKGGEENATIQEEEWWNARIGGLQEKFKIVKRVMQLTGMTVADSKINSAATVKDLVSIFTAPPPKQKLNLTAIPEVAELPNVRVYRKRYSPVVRETEKGRVHPVLARSLMDADKKAKGEEVDRFKYPFEKGQRMFNRVKGTQTVYA